jgi:hypothetical protein
MNIRESRRDNQEWIIQRHMKHCAKGTEQRETKQNTQHKKLKRLSIYNLI